MPLSIQNVEEKYSDNLVNGKVIAKLTTREDGTVEIQFGRDNWSVHGSTLVFTPIIKADGSVKWACVGGSLEQRYRPDECEQKEPSP